MPEPSAGAREAARQACAHLRVSWRTRQLTSGHTEGWWECDTGCGERFAPTSFLESVAAARVAEEREEIQALRSCAEKRARWQEEAESENERLRAVVEAARLVARYTVVNEIASRAMSEQALVGALLQTRLEALDRPAGMMEVRP